MPLASIQCNNKMANILLLLPFAFNEGCINKKVEVLLNIVRRVKRIDNMVKAKLTLLKEDFLTIRNTRYVICWQQNEFLLLLKFYLLELVASLFYL